MCVDNLQRTRSLLFRTYEIAKSNKCALLTAVSLFQSKGADWNGSTFEARVLQLNQRTDMLPLNNSLTQLLIRRNKHPYIRSHEAKLPVIGNQIKQPINERCKEIGFTILIAILHELFELGAHVLRAHVWRVRHYCRVFAGETPCLGENLLRAFT